MILESIEKNSYDAMFNIFAELHPVEAFDLNKSKFCKYVKSKNKHISNKEIETLINQMRTE